MAKSFLVSLIQKYCLKMPAILWAFLFITISIEVTAGETKTDHQSVPTTSSFYDSEWKPFAKKLTDESSLKIFVAAVLSTAASHQFDEFTRNEWKDYQRLNEKQSKIGDFLGTGIPALMILGGQYIYDKPQATPHLRALLWGNVFTYSLKAIASRKRPGDSRSYQSFPSGHTSTTFATATVLTYSYGWTAAAITYPLAFYTGASRLAEDSHWFSDVVAGAYLGFLIGRASSFSTDYQDSSAENNFVNGIKTSPENEFLCWPEFWSNNTTVQFYLTF